MLKDEKRIKAIKEKHIFFAKKCKHCGESIKRENMWVVKRYGVNGEVFKYYYCKDCFPTKEDVLREIDTDEILFGIAYVDDFFGYKKKDYTRLNATRPKIPGNR